MQDNEGALTVAEFLAAYKISRTMFYEEVNAGRLVIRKLGVKTLIGTSDAKRWFDSLPSEISADVSDRMRDQAASPRHWVHP